MKLVEIMLVRLFVTLFIGFAAAQGQSPDDKIQQLEQKIGDLDQRLKIAERRQEIKAEEEAGRAKSAASVSP